MLMLRKIVFFFFLFVGLSLFAQQNYTVSSYVRGNFYNRGRISTESLRASDDLIFLNVHPDKDGSLSFENPRAFQGKGVTTWEGLIKSVRAKVKGTKAKIRLGASSGEWKAMVADETARTAFARNIKKVLEKNKLDGIDLDFEWAENEKEYEDYSLAIVKMREVLGDKYIFSVSLHPVCYKISRKAIDAVDFISLQCYGPSPVRFPVEKYDSDIQMVLKYGIPEFRLPNKVVDVEIDNLAKMGVNFIKDCIIGKTISVEQLEEEGFKGVFVASGAGLPNFMNIPGENSINILSSNEYLTRVNLMDAASEDSDTPVPFGRNVAVIGGGNTAMDSVRTARRLGAERAMIIYRRSEEEMPARIEEVKHAKEEGVEFLTLHNPIEYIADEQGKVKQVILQKMELGEPDASGRRSPVAIPGATETIDIDLAIVSVGVSPNPIVPSSIPGLEMGRKGTIAVNENMQSSIPTIYAGGDIVRGGATVILAMGDGRKAAASMHEQLSK